MHEDVKRKSMSEEKVKKKKKALLSFDGTPMTRWQIWLRRLCFVMIVWAALELVLGIVILVAGQNLPAEALEGIQELSELSLQEVWVILGMSALVGAFFDVVIAFLGLRGARDPHKITLFFWIALIDGVLTAWALASSISQGAVDPASLGSGLFIIALAICAWKVREQTGYFDRHP